MGAMKIMGGIIVVLKGNELVLPPPKGGIYHAPRQIWELSNLKVRGEVCIMFFLLKKSSKELGAELEKIYFRTMKTKWASCSSKRNLTFNALMKHLPDYLIKYVIFHEIAHLQQKRHNDEFWKRISKKFKNYQELERDLFVYWFQVSKALPSLKSSL